MSGLKGRQNAFLILLEFDESEKLSHSLVPVGSQELPASSYGNIDSLQDVLRFAAIRLWYIWGMETHDKKLNRRLKTQAGFPQGLQQELLIKAPANGKSIRRTLPKN